MEKFQNNANIDLIAVVCIDGWHDFIKAYARQFGINKLNRVIEGGGTRHESIYKGLCSLADIASQDDIILVMDANRPLVEDRVIDDSIEKCKLHQFALPVAPCVDSMYFSENGDSGIQNLERSRLFKGQTPESIQYQKAVELYQKANDQELDALSTSALLIHFGEPVQFSEGSEKNIKITTAEDIEIFKALLNSKNDVWIK